MKQIVNITTLYANKEEVLDYANTVSQQTVAENIALVIVVNKLGETQLEDFKSKLKTLPLKTFIFNPNKNLGYLNGVIYGYTRYCQISYKMPKWVVISNTDIEFSNNKFFEDFIHNDYDDDVWCVAPSVYSLKKNSYDNPEYINRCNKKKIDRLIYIYERSYLAYLYTEATKIKAKFGRSKKQKSQYIYSAKGCFFIIRNEFALLLKDKKYKALMYSEESYIAEIIRKYNRKTYYDCTIEVIHNKNTVTEKLQFQQKAKYIANSLKVIRDEFYIEDKSTGQK